MSTDAIGREVRAEVESGKCKRFDSIDALMADLRADEIDERSDDLKDLPLAEGRLAQARSGTSASHTIDEVERRLGLLD